jgi:hypothetical protein
MILVDSTPRQKSAVYCKALIEFRCKLFKVYRKTTRFVFQRLGSRMPLVETRRALKGLEVLHNMFATFSAVRYSTDFLMLSSPGRSCIYYVGSNIPCSLHSLDREPGPNPQTLLLQLHSIYLTFTRLSPRPPRTRPVFAQCGKE